MVDVRVIGCVVILVGLLAPGGAAGQDGGGWGSEPVPVPQDQQGGKWPGQEDGEGDEYYFDLTDQFTLSPDYEDSWMVDHGDTGGPVLGTPPPVISNDKMGEGVAPHMLLTCEKWTPCGVCTCCFSSDGSNRVVCQGSNITTIPWTTIPRNATAM